MKRHFILLLVPLILSLLVLGCKKDEEDPIKHPNNAETEQDIRTSVYSFTISGDFEGDYEISVANAEGVTGGVVGVYETDVHEFGLSMTATGMPENGTWGLGLFAVMTPLAPGNYALGNVDFDTSWFTFVDNSTNVSFTIDSGWLNITNVEQAPVFIPGGVSARYINGTFSIGMSNDDNETAIAQGQFVNGVIIVY